MRAFLRNIEIYLTIAGLALTMLVPSLGGWHNDDWWRVAAITATIVGILHGLIFWVVRRRQRQVRATLIAELRAMLKDRLNNQLMLLVGETTLQADLVTDGPLVEVVNTHAQRVKTLLDNLSDESLRAWQRRYAPGSGTDNNLERL